MATAGRSVTTASAARRRRCRALGWPASWLRSRCGAVFGRCRRRTPHDEQLANVLHGRRFELDTDTREHGLALATVGAGHANLDQFMRQQIDIDFVQYRGREALSPDAYHRIQAVRSGTQFAARRGSQGKHGESLAHCRGRSVDARSRARADAEAYRRKRVHGGEPMGVGIAAERVLTIRTTGSDNPFGNATS